MKDLMDFGNIYICMQDAPGEPYRGVASDQPLSDLAFAFEEENPMVQWLKAVSYTHLDVYKRQGRECFFSDFRIYRQCGFAICIPESWRKQTPAYQKRLSRCISAVSYTHLDVYKRQ